MASGGQSLRTSFLIPPFPTFDLLLSWFPIRMDHTASLPGLKGLNSKRWWKEGKENIAS